MAKPNTTQGAKKKSEATNKRNNLVPGDPPIIVGGGGSSLVWIRKDQMPQLIDPGTIPPEIPANPNAPAQPANPGKYHIFILNALDITSVNVHDGQSSHPSKPVKNKNKHATHFI